MNCHLKKADGSACGWCYGLRMLWRPQRLTVAVDVFLVLLITAAFEWQVAATGDHFGSHVEGPSVLNAILPLFFAVPLMWRRRWPLVTASVALAGMAVQALASGHSPESLEYIALWVLWPYSSAAYTTPRRSVVGLAVVLAAYSAHAATNDDITSGQASEVWAGAFFLLLALGAWLAGSAARARRDQTMLHVHAAAVEQQAQRAVDDERARIARELHDIVAHNLSVVVVQAAGARALSPANEQQASALAKIERTGREALVEMRRLLGVLRRDDGADDTTAPSPGVADLPDLIERLQGAGMQLALEVVGDCERLPAAVGQSAYRIIQESLTNTLKHAGREARVSVRLAHSAEICEIEVIDDGAGRQTPRPHAETPGHGLIGMRERVEVFGGEVSAGPIPGAPGFRVRARLPLHREAPT